MAYIGTNNLIIQFKQKTEDLINDGLRDGIPPVVIKLVLDQYKRISDDLVNQFIQKENEKYRQQLAEEQAQEKSEVENDNV